MGAYHAKLGPSGAFRWSVCTASIKAALGIVDAGNEAARIGTVKHGVSSEALEAGCETSEFLGREFLFCVDAEGGRHENFRELLGDISAYKVEHVYTIDQEMVDHSDAYVSYVRDLVATTGGKLLVEKRVPIDFITGEGRWVDYFGNEVPEGSDGAVWEPAGGTADAIILTPDGEIIVVDAKFGYGKVTAYDVVKPETKNLVTGNVEPPVIKANTQLAMYGAGARHAYDPERRYKRVRLIVVQPPLNHLSEFALPVEKLDAQMEELRTAAIATRENPVYAPDADRCHFCKARDNCQARDELVLTTALEGFEDATSVAELQAAKPRTVQGNRLGTIYGLLPMIEQWCKEMGARVYAALQQGEPVVQPDGIALKLVDGKLSNREWKDPKAVEREMKESMRLADDVMYEPRSVISPAAAEKLVKVRKPKKGVAPPPAPIGPTQWTRLQELIAEQKPGRPIIVPETDPRPAAAAVLDGFGDETQPVAADSADAIDLFN